LTVTPAELTSIAVTPNASIVVGQTRQYTATGTYTDSTTQDLNASVTWSSTNASAAIINGSGFTTAKNTGSTSIAATSGTISGSTDLTVNAGSTAISLASSANPSVSGQNITLTATVTAVAPAAGTATGSVTFTDGGGNLGSAALDASGQATLNVTFLSPGAHPLIASYSGDGNFNVSSSTPLAQTVNKG